jgi:hypothetical protein
LQTMARHAIVSGDRDCLKQDMQTAPHDRRRLLSASFCLLAVVLLYAPIAAAAWSSYSAACCTTAQCPIKSHHHQSKNSPASSDNHMDCGHDMAGMSACSMSCCQNTEPPAMVSLAFVLPTVLSLTGPAVRKAPIESAKPLDFLRSVEPLSPPPRLETAAA